MGFRGGVWRRGQLQGELRCRWYGTWGGSLSCRGVRIQHYCLAEIQCFTHCREILRDHFQCCTSLPAQEQFVSINGQINSLVGFGGLPRWGSACESQDDCIEYLYAIVVCSVHVHCYGDQVIFAEAKASDYFDASQATLATGISYGGDSDCFRLRSYRLVS